MKTSCTSVTTATNRGTTTADNDGGEACVTQVRLCAAGRGFGIARCRVHGERELTWEEIVRYAYLAADLGALKDADVWYMRRAQDRWVESQKTQDVVKSRLPKGFHVRHRCRSTALEECACIWMREGRETKD